MTTNYFYITCTYKDLEEEHQVANKLPGSEIETQKAFCYMTLPIFHVTQLHVSLYFFLQLRYILPCMIY